MSVSKLIEVAMIDCNANENIEEFAARYARIIAQHYIRTVSSEDVAKTVHEIKAWMESGESCIRIGD